MAVVLSAFPHVPLGHWPTPIDECPRLSDALGVRVLVKRDDVGGVGLGGNKLRKLEFLLGAALADGVDTVVTFGALQTNHGRQTAAACARLGLRCELILTAKVPRSGEAYEHSGNVLLDHLYGATVHVCADADEAQEVYRRVLDSGRRVATIPVGGSSPLGVLGYVAATVELFTQLDSVGLEPNRVVVPTSSAGTAAGVLLGASLMSRPAIIHAACASDTAAELDAAVRGLAADAATLMGREVPAFDRLYVSDVTAGPAYGVPNEETWDAMRVFARLAGITLDPVYTGKAAAALVEDVRTGVIRQGETVVFVHTGGVPALFAYADSFSG